MNTNWNDTMKKCLMATKASPLLPPNMVEKPLLMVYVSAKAGVSEGNSLEISSSISPRDFYDSDNIKTCDSTRIKRNSQAAFLG